MNFLQAARRGLAVERKELPQYGQGGFAGGYGGLWQLSGSSFNYRSEAGPIYDNAIVAICLNWMVRKLTQTRVVVQRLHDDYSLVLQPDNDAVKAVQRANDGYGEETLFAGALMGLTINGNGYWIKRKNLLGRVAGYFWAYHGNVEPHADHDVSGVPNDGTRLVTRYTYSPVGGTGRSVDPSEVLHFRWPLPDPKNPMLGLSELAALLRQVCSHNEISTHDAALHRNMGMPGVMLIPKASEVEAPTPEQKTRLKRLWKLFTGEGMGEPFLAPFPLDVQSPAFSPEQMTSTASRHVNATELCAAMGLDPMAVHLFSESKTYANMAEAREDAIESALLPKLAILSNHLTRQARVDFGMEDPRLRLGFDLSGFRELSEDEDRRHKRIREDFKANLLQLNEARKLLGQEEVDGGERLWSEIAGSANTAPESDTPEKRLQRIKEMQAELLGSAAKARKALEAIDAKH